MFLATRRDGIHANLMCHWGWEMSSAHCQLAHPKRCLDMFLETWFSVQSLCRCKKCIYSNTVQFVEWKKNLKVLQCFPKHFPVIHPLFGGFLYIHQADLAAYWAYWTAPLEVGD